ncbi:hypothetical protein L3V83_11050 [Thiotrichales bacterium 19X7-9]|nr:hypothetical protein [Thiotrichales bacterium 19X7-9]TNF69980.1 MAG: hypothetical protein EP298_01265 [Gammaproteobacteria bacterium]UTW41980.1 hypothetical protein KFE69_10775 [bacterium SCSIO 12844]
MALDFSNAKDRVIYLRRLTKLSQKNFCEEAGFDDMIGVATLRLVESNKRDLTKYVAEKVCKRARNLGIECSANWLLFNEGEPPRATKNEYELYAPESRGDRLRYLQTLARVTDKEIGTQYGDKAIQAWRHGKYGGVHVVAGNDLTDEFQKHGIFATPEWLLLGKYLSPVIGDKKAFEDKQTMLELVARILNDGDVQTITGKSIFSKCVGIEVKDPRMLNDTLCCVDGRLMYLTYRYEGFSAREVDSEETMPASFKEGAKIYQVTLLVP